MHLSIVLSLCSPLLGFLLVGLSLSRISFSSARTITCSLMGVAAVSSFALIESIYLRGHYICHLFPFMEVGSFQVFWGIQLDALSVLMIGMVNVISFMVHVYSVGYMHDDPSAPRFMAYLSFFTFCMLLLVISPNLIQLFVGWEGVGLASYLLIGYYHHRARSNHAAVKAFIVNRIGDMGFILAVCLVFRVFGTVEFSEIFQNVPLALKHLSVIPGYGPFPTVTLICGLFFIAAMTKSAQFGLHVWLPDAMEGPTPVSALIHAATMVTAGIFLMVRLSPLLEFAPAVRQVILICGACTAFFGATVACTQTDIKRIIAYSTCSQLGYMFMAIGVSAYGASMFHLTTHAFFKSLLFLAAGSVIHALSGVQDLREMGGLYRLIPATYGAFWVGSLALAGIPFFSGFFSKEAIFQSLWQHGSSISHYAFGAALIATFLTAFYSWRLLWLVFHGSSRAHSVVLGRVQESPPVMLVPLLVLSVASVFLGLSYPLFLGADPMWGKAIFVLPVFSTIIPSIFIEWIPVACAVGGIFTALFLYHEAPLLRGRVVFCLRPFYVFLVHRWYVDELYQMLFVKPLWRLSSFLWHWGDVRGIDRWGPEGVTFLVNALARGFSYLQTGYLYHYAFYMVMGLLGGIIFLMMHFYF